MGVITIVGANGRVGRRPKGPADDTGEYRQPGVGRGGHWNARAGAAAVPVFPYRPGSASATR